MKKIINGRLYNTETATRIAIYWNGYSGGNFNRVCKELYKKKNGEYFIYIEGGANTAFGTHSGDMWGDGYHIEPVDEKYAKKFVEENESVETYIELFGEVEE